MGEVRKYHDLGPVHQRLLELCPPDDQGVVSIAILAKHLGLSPAGVYKWISAGRVPPQRVPELVDLQLRAFGAVRVPARDLNPLFGSPSERKLSPTFD